MKQLFRFLAPGRAGACAARPQPTAIIPTRRASPARVADALRSVRRHS